MIDCLISGKLFGQVEQRTGRTGKSFTTARVRAAVGNGEALFVRVVAFSDSAQAALLALTDGDALSLAGQLTPTAWVDREGQARAGADLVAQQVLTPYHSRRKRAAMQPKAEATDGAAERGWSDEA